MEIKHPLKTLSGDDFVSVRDGEQGIGYRIKLEAGQTYKAKRCTEIGGTTLNPGDLIKVAVLNRKGTIFTTR